MTVALLFVLVSRTLNMLRLSLEFQRRKRSKIRDWSKREKMLLPELVDLVYLKCSNYSLDSSLLLLNLIFSPGSSVGPFIFIV